MKEVILTEVYDWKIDFAHILSICRCAYLMS